MDLHGDHIAACALDEGFTGVRGAVAATIGAFSSCCLSRTRPAQGDRDEEWPTARRGISGHRLWDGHARGDKACFCLSEPHCKQQFSNENQTNLS